MSESEERPTENEPNPTQERMDEEGLDGAPVDVPWEEPEETEE